MSSVLRRFRFVLSTVLVLTLGAALVATPGNAVPREVREKAIPATVKVYALDNDLAPIGHGSGSILVSTGQVLTNYHVVSDPRSGELAHDDGIVLVSITADPRNPPIPSYLGKVIRSDPKLDLAVVTVVSDISGRDLQDCLTLPAYEVGDSDELIIGDQIAVIGFPGLGGNSVTYTEGSISGFEAAAQWIKTDTEINPGNSGGSAIDSDGKLIGVPSAGRTSRGSDMQGKIGLIRPIAAAVAITEDIGGLGVPGCQGSSQLGPVPETGSHGPNYVDFAGYTLSPGARKAARSAPSGTTELYAHFLYVAMRADTPVSFEWLLNGRPTRAAETSDAWPFEAGDGVFTLSATSPAGFPDGRYSVRFTAGDRSITTPEIVVGSPGAAEAGPDEVTPAAVSVKGRVVSADTGRPVPGALFVVLAPGIDWDNIDLDNREHVLDLSVANADGAFQSGMPFPVDERYAVGVLAEGFEPALYQDVDLTRMESAGRGFVDAGTIELKAR